VNAAIRATDFVDRLAGDEFYLLLPGCADKDLDDISHRIEALVGPRHSYSIGFASWDGRESGAAAVARADASMYRAKKARANAGKARTP
jgi:GGDEF domain-containing protein